MKTIKFWDIPNLIEELDFDGDKEDTRLHVDNQFCMNWGAREEVDYKEAEEKIDKFEIFGKGFEVYMWCDISGYDYWMKENREQNYIQTTVSFDNEDFDMEEIENLRIAVLKAIDFAMDIALDNLFHPRIDPSEDNY